MLKCLASVRFQVQSVACDLRLRRQQGLLEIWNLASLSAIV